jgi:hypothetical protein
VIATEYGTGYAGIGHPYLGFQSAARVAAWQPGPILAGPPSSVMLGAYPGVGYGQSIGPVVPPSVFAPAWPAWNSPMPTPIQPLDDDAIRELVFEMIDADPTVLPDVDVEIDVNAGIVTLKGRVPGKRTKHAVGEAAWWIPSVVDVNNQLQVSPRRERRSERVGAARGAA